MISSKSTFNIALPPDPRPNPPDTKSHHPKPGSKEFSNPWPSFTGLPNLLTYAKAKLLGQIGVKDIPKDISQLIGVDVPCWDTGDKGKIKAMWLGHASVYIELPCHESQEHGLRILIDPIFSKRASPISFLGFERFTEAPISVDQLPEIDIVCISHNHYDHLDTATMKGIHKRFGDSVHFFIPLGVASCFQSWKISSFTELDWWEERIIQKDGLEARVGFLPAQHNTNRGLFDQFTSLWGSYSLESTSHPEQRIWCAGDTGRRSIPQHVEENLPDSQAELDALPICPAHKQIGDLRGPFAFAAIPIGTYKPRYLMSSAHVDPEEAIEVFREVRAKRAVGIHWGTWSTSGEGVLAPKEELAELCKKKGIVGFETWRLAQRVEI